MAAAEVDGAARIAQLEDELATAKAQADAVSIDWEQASQAMEQRYSALSDEYEKAIELREKISTDLEAAKEELAVVKSDNHRLQALVVEKDATLKQQSVKMAQLESDVQRLLRLSEQKDARLAEQQELVSSYLGKVQTVTNERVEMSARLHAAERISSQATSIQERLNQEKANLEKHNLWLTEELDRKSEDMLTNNRATGEQLAQARGELQAAKFRITQLENSEKGFKQRLQTVTSDLEAVHRRAEEAGQQTSTQIMQLKRELETSHKLAELRREAAEAAKARSTELEGILREMTEKTEAAISAKDNALQKEEEIRKAVEAECAELRGRIGSLMSAAQTGQQISRELDFGGATPGGARSTPGGLTPPAPSSLTLGSGLTPSELYRKYEQKDAECRQERLERRRVEKMMDEMVRQVEIRAAVMKEQQGEHDRVMDSYQTLQETLAAADTDRQRLEREKVQLNTQLNQLEKERRRSEQMLKDLGAQVQHLLWENQELSGNANGTQAPPQTPHNELDAGDVISARLVNFSGVQELQQQNQHLLTLTRDLAQQLEEKEKEAKEELDEALTQKTKNLQAQLEELINSRKRQQEMVEQIIRQRDLYKDMLARAKAVGAGVLGSPEGAAASGSNGSAGMVNALLASGPGAGGSRAAGDGPDYKTAYDDAVVELEKVRKESKENSNMLQKDKSELQEQIAMLRGQTEQAIASAAFERDRYQRLVDSSDSHRRELEATLARNAEMTTMLTDRERKLRDTMSELEGMQFAVRREREKAAALQVEKGVLAAAESRASTEAAQLSKETFKLTAILESSQKLSEQQLEDSQRDRARLNEEVKRMTLEWSEIQRVLTTEKAAAASAARSLEEATKAAAEFKASAEEDIKSLREAKAASDQRAAVAEGKVEVITASLKKAEERASNLARTGTMDSSAMQAVGAAAGAQHEASLSTEMVILRQELAAAQEAAAAAAGHAAQYKAIATSSDEALKAMQQSHESYKTEAAAAAEEATKAQETLKKKLEETDKELAEVKAAEQVSQGKLLSLEGAVERETASLRAQLTEAEGRVANMSERAKALEADVEQHHKSWRTAQQMYEQELLQHADKVKALNQAEADQEGLKAELESVRQEVDKLRVEASALTAEIQAERTAKQQVSDQCNARASELTAQNAELHKQLEKLVKDQQGSGGADGQSDLAEVIRYLRVERETAECQLALLQQEKARWEAQAARSDRAATQAREQLEAQLSRTSTNAATEEEHRELMNKVQHLNLLRESNDMLRTECEAHLANLRKAKAETEAANKRAEEMDKRVRAAGASLQARDSELAVSKENAQRWENRSQELLQKMKTVDPREHQKVCDELKVLKEKLATVESAAEEAKKMIQAELETTKATLTKSQNQERIAKRQITSVFNPGKLSLDEWKKAQLAKDKKIADLEAAAAKAGKAGESPAPPAAAPAAAGKPSQALAQLQAQAQAQVAALTEERNKLKEELAPLKESAAKAAKALESKQIEVAKIEEARVAATTKLTRAIESNKKLVNDKKQLVETLKKARTKKESLEKEIADKSARIKQLEEQVVSLGGTPVPATPESPPAPAGTEAKPAAPVASTTPPAAQAATAAAPQGTPEAAPPQGTVPAAEAKKRPAEPIAEPGAGSSPKKARTEAVPEVRQPEVEAPAQEKEQEIAPAATQEATPAAAECASQAADAFLSGLAPPEESMGGTPMEDSATAPADDVPAPQERAPPKVEKAPACLSAQPEEMEDGEYAEADEAMAEVEEVIEEEEEAPAEAVGDEGQQIETEIDGGAPAEEQARQPSEEREEGEVPAEQPAEQPVKQSDDPLKDAAAKAEAQSAAGGAGGRSKPAPIQWQAGSITKPPVQAGKGTPTALAAAAALAASAASGPPAAQPGAAATADGGAGGGPTKAAANAQQIAALKAAIGKATASMGAAAAKPVAPEAVAPEPSSQVSPGGRGLGPAAAAARGGKTAGKAARGRGRTSRGRGRGRGDGGPQA